MVQQAAFDTSAAHDRRRSRVHPLYLIRLIDASHQFRIDTVKPLSDGAFTDCMEQLQDARPGAILLRTHIA